MNIKEIIQKLKDIISEETKGYVFDKDVACELGLSPSSLAQHKLCGTVPFYNIAFFCAKRKISINWVLFDQDPDLLIQETSKYIKIKYFANINTSAGGGAVNFDDDYEIVEARKSMLEGIWKSGVPTHVDLKAIHVVGDSMEPTLKNGDVILIDDRPADLKDMDVHVVLVGEELLVKRINVKGQCLNLISDNSAYQPIKIGEVSYGDVIFKGKVLGKIGV